MTYPYFTGATVVLDHLKNICTSSNRANETPEKLKYFASCHQRVIYILRKWMTNYYDDFFGEKNGDAMTALRELIHSDFFVEKDRAELIALFEKVNYKNKNKSIDQLY